MLSILKELSLGNINPNERSFKRNTEYDSTLKALSVSEKNLLDALGEDEKSLYEALSTAQMNFNDLENAESFVLGFRLGARIVFEVMNDDDDLITG